MSSVILKDNTFMNVIDLLKDLLDECIIEFTKTSININTIDKMKISYIKINLEDVYKKCNLKKSVKININLVELQKIFKCQEKDESLKIVFKQDFIEIVFVNNIYDTY